MERTEMSGRPVQGIPGVIPASRVDYALRYAGAGWRVLALHWIDAEGKCSCKRPRCLSAGKHPLAPAGFGRGVVDATSDTALLAEVFTKYPSANIGISPPPGTFILDVDPRNGGDTTLDELSAEHGRLPDSVMQITGGGGMHIVLRRPASIAITGKLGQGIDVKTDTGYIVAEPSIHASGRAYAWEAESSLLDDVAIAPAPAWVLGRLSRGTAPVGTVNVAPGAVWSVDERTIADLKAAIAFIDADDRSTWIDMGQALKSIGDAGFSIWDTWSRTSDKYNQAEMAHKWHSFSPSSITYKSIFKRAQDAGWKNTPSAAPAAAPERTPFLDVAELVQNIKPVSWLVRGYFEADSIALIYGAPGAAKSFLAVDLACAVATGTPWFGNAVHAGTVFYIAGEGHSGLARRFRAWEQARGIRIPHGRLYKSPGAIQALDEGEVIWVADEIERVSAASGVAPALIVIDTLARNFGGDENSTQDMSRFINHLDRHLRERFHATVAIVHHSGHNMDRARGSSALKAAVDSEYEVARDDQAGVRVRATKMKDAEIPPELMLELRGVELPGVVDEDGEPATSAALSISNATLSAEVAKGISAKQVLESLDAEWLSVRALAEQLGCSKSAAERAVESVANAGYIDKAGKCLTEAGRTALSRTGAYLVSGKPSKAINWPWQKEE